MSIPIPLSRVRDCVVVGGGIAGCTVAYELARRGLRVTLFERRGLAHAASGRNMGLLLNQVEAGAVATMRQALEVYRELEGTADLRLRQQDQLILAADEDQLRSASERAAEMRSSGLEAEVMGEDRLRHELPLLAAGLAGGAVIRGTWALEPAAATLAFAQAARAFGAEIRTGVTVSRVDSGGVLSDAGRTTADVVVVATGPWVADLVPRLPVSAGRGWCLRAGRLPARLPWMVRDMTWPDSDRLAEEARSPTLAAVAGGAHDEPVAEAFVIVQRPDGDALIGTSLAPSLRDAVEGVDMPRRVAARAMRLMPGLGTVPITAAWYGMRPMTPDGKPISGRASDGLWVHGGHGSTGMASAPATARSLVDALMDGGLSPVDLGPERFELGS